MSDFDWSRLAPSKLSPIPLYYQLAEFIDEQIQTGTLLPGDRLPSERDLADQVKISRMTARQALTYLANRGAIEIRHGIGTFVAEPKLTSDPLHVLGFTEQMMATGGAVSSAVLGQEVIPASSVVANALGIEVEQHVVRVMRLRSLDNVPMLLETSFFPYALCGGIEQADLARTSLYTLLASKYGIHLRHAHQTVEAIAANAYESELFSIAKGLPMLLLEGVASTEEGVAGEYFKAVYRGDRFKFALRTPDVPAADAGISYSLPIDLVLT